MRTSLLLVGISTTINAAEQLGEDGLSYWITEGLKRHDAADVPPGAPANAGGYSSTESEPTTTITITAACSASGLPGLPSLALNSTLPSTTTTLLSYSSPSAATLSTTAPWPTSSGACALPSTPLTNEQQVGDSTLGTLCNPTLPKWLDDANGKPYSSAPWGDRTTESTDATIHNDVPETDVTRKYDFTLSRSEISPDGVLRDVILANNQFPGPTIEANWGDWIEVTVYNNITNPGEGTALHWHGMLQRGTPWEDGTPGVSQCPVAPGSSYTYRFQAEVYGSSFWHAHYSAQYTAGVVGPMVVHGPASAEYDIDLGAVMLSDWNHIPYFSMVDNVVGTDLSLIPPLSDDGLINGRGQFDCSQPSYSNSSDWLGTNLQSNLTWTCVDGAQRAQFRFQQGKTHRLRLMNTGADGVQKFSIDGHSLLIIAIDYVPVVPYSAEVITLGVGQRTDIVVTADQDAASSWWMRTQLPGEAFCGGLGTPTGPDGEYPQVLAGVYYDNADTTADPPSTSTLLSDTSCSNDALNLTVPSYPIPSTNDSYIQDLLLGLVLNETGSWNFLINNQTYRANFNEPLLYTAASLSSTNISTYPWEPEWNVYNFYNNKSITLNITNQTPFYHPFHLHGHTFHVLDVGDPGIDPSANPDPSVNFTPDPNRPQASWPGLTVNPDNPTRRDVQLIPPFGYAALQFSVEAPGVWPFHCHSAWHLSGGQAINIVVQPESIAGIPHGTRDLTCAGWDAFSATNSVNQVDSGS